jgi:hypothetical protein
MEESDSKSTIHAQDAMVRIATNETSHTQDRAANNAVNASDQNTKNDIDAEAGDVGTQTLELVTPADEKVKLQDQTNLLPLKQLLIVFAGLSCALFCKSSHYPTLAETKRADRMMPRFST